MSEKKVEKKGFMQGIKDAVKKVKGKVDAFAEKHPTATKVIKGVVILGTVAGAGAVAYSIGKNHDSSDGQIMLEATSTTNMEPNGVDAWETKRKEEDLKDWEANKDNWQKVLEVADGLNLKNDSTGYGDGYHIYSDDDGNTQVAHIENGDYHYPPEQPAEPEVVTEPEVEG